MLLVIDTATEACSVALFDGETLVAERHEIVGRGHAERLIPMIAELPDNGRADRILVDCGPGSFTGIRVGLAAARGLAIGWRAAVAGYSSLPLIAAARFAKSGAPDRLAVAIPGGHGEMFVQLFTARPFAAERALASLTPAAAVAAVGELALMGGAAEELAALRGGGSAEQGWPRAADAALLPAAFTTLAPSPIYGRAPDARPMAAR